MPKLFLSDTKLSGFEKLMQEIPSAVEAERYEKQLYSKYITFIKWYMKQNGYISIIQQVENVIEKMDFDEFIYKDKRHKNMFLKSKKECLNRHLKCDNLKESIIYLLSSDEALSDVLEKYIIYPKYIFTDTFKKKNINSYNIYQCIRLIKNESLEFKESIFMNHENKDEVLCLFVNGKIISKYGLYGYIDLSIGGGENYG